MYKNIYARRLLEILQTGPRLGNSVIYVTNVKKDEETQDKELEIDGTLEKKIL